MMRALSESRQWIDMQAPVALDGASRYDYPVCRTTCRPRFAIGVFIECQL